MELTKYVIIDKNSVPPVPVSPRPFVSRKRAEGKMNKMNNEYGAYRYCVRTVITNYTVIR